MAICPICGRETRGKNRICDSPICRKELQNSWYESSIAIPEGYLSVTEFAKKRNISVQAVAKNCRAGKYPGAVQEPQSGRWYIPEDLEGTIPLAEFVRRTARMKIKATDKEWQKIVERAAATKYSVNEYLIRLGLGKSV
ncbi:MAG: hypothetical protein HPY66_1681 [Firmicutes bacterium]|nr:hypothetical protein [Bacillota bacterium]